MKNIIILVLTAFLLCDLCGAIPLAPAVHGYCDSFPE
jgi:hypothetical protein